MNRCGAVRPKADRKSKIIDPKLTSNRLPSGNTRKINIRGLYYP
jgi:hypothetical protein